MMLTPSVVLLSLVVFLEAAFGQTQLSVQYFNATTMTTYGTTAFNDYTLVLNPSNFSQVGNAYYPTPITFYQAGAHLSFSTYFKFSITGCSSACADGMAFLVRAVYRTSFHPSSSFLFLPVDCHRPLSWRTRGIPWSQQFRGCR